MVHDKGKRFMQSVDFPTKFPKEVYMQTIKNSGRALAIRVLGEILQDGAYGNIALRKALKGSPSAQENAFVTELVTVTLRNLTLIDYIIDGFVKAPADGMKPFIQNLLRVSVCQIRLLKRTPDHAAVNEAVELAKGHGYRNLAGFVNGVLRNIARNPLKPTLPAESPDDPESLALLYSFPVWLVKELQDWLGQDEAHEFIKLSHKPPVMTVYTNTTRTGSESLTERLLSAGVVVTETVPAAKDSGDLPFLTLSRTGDIANLAAFKAGHFFVMDPGGAAAVKALCPMPGQTVYDLAAAPGGKSFAIACLMENRGVVKAFDIHPHRVELIRSSKRRLGLDIVEPMTNDLLSPNPALEETADAVLLDAPCSGLGTIRKHPETKYNRSTEDIENLSKQQKAMLASAAKYVKPGGKLVYCTCTVAPMENDMVADEFAQSHPGFTLDSKRLIPPGEENDGFFIATFSKKLQLH